MEKFKCPNCGVELVVSLVVGEPKEEMKPIEVEEVKGWLKDYTDIVDIVETEDKIVVKPKGFLGPNLFSGLASACRKHGFKYISAGRESRFETDKTR